jgi:putative ABC transport system substrate-binding protein
MKKYGKKVVVLAIAMMLTLAVFGFAGCATSSEPSAAVSESEVPTPTPEPTEAPTEAPKTYTLGISQIVTHPALDACRQGAIDALAELGFVEGDNLTVDYQNSEGDSSVASTIAQQFVSEKVDVIMAISTPSAQSACAAAMGNIPVVFSAVTDPVVGGFANEDGSNMAGVTGTSDALPIDGMLQLIKQLTPNAVNVGILHTTSEVNSDVQLAKAQELAPNYGLNIIDVGITSTNEMGTALDTLLPQVDVVMNLTDNSVVSALALEIEKCDTAGIPLYGSEDSQVKAGALASAGIDYYSLGKKTGELIAEILGGKAAEDVPISTSDETSVTINSDRIAALEITVPDDLKSATMVTTGQE